MKKIKNNIFYSFNIIFFMFSLFLKNMIVASLNKKALNKKALNKIKTEKLNNLFQDFFKNTNKLNYSDEKYHLNFKLEYGSNKNELCHIDNLTIFYKSRKKDCGITIMQKYFLRLAMYKTYLEDNKNFNFRKTKKILLNILSENLTTNHNTVNNFFDPNAANRFFDNDKFLKELKKKIRIIQAIKIPIEIGNIKSFLVQL